MLQAIFWFSRYWVVGVANAALIRNLLGDNSEQTHEQGDIPSCWVELMIFLTGEDPTVCKKCGIGRMVNVTSVPGASIRYG